MGTANISEGSTDRWNFEIGGSQISNPRSEMFDRGDGRNRKWKAIQARFVEFGARTTRVAKALPGTAEVRYNSGNNSDLFMAGLISRGKLTSLIAEKPAPLSDISGFRIRDLRFPNFKISSRYWAAKYNVAPKW